MKYLLLVAGWLIAVPTFCATGTLFLTKDDALKLYFPDAQIERKTEYLSPEQKTAVKQKAHAPMEARVVTYYVARKNNVVIGYAFFETVTVRTKDATYMVAVNPDATVRGVEILAFYEPPDYKPIPKWFGQFYKKGLDDDLNLRSGIRNIAGATLSAQALSDGVRRILSIYSLIVAK